MALATKEVCHQLFGSDGVGIDGAILKVALSANEDDLSDPHTRTAGFPAEQTFTTDNLGEALMGLVPNRFGTTYLVAVFAPSTTVFATKNALQIVSINVPEIGDSFALLDITV